MSPGAGRKRADGWVLLGLAILSAVLFVLMMDRPIYGDAYGYGYRSARWMLEHDLQPIPGGEGKGESAMGHPAGFFWLWALLMRLLGDHVRVAHLLPAFATFAGLAGMYRLGSSLGGTVVGVASSLALLASPLYITQAMRPLPEAAMIAAVAWSLYHYAAGRRVAAAALCFLGVMMREQAVLLAGAYFLIELRDTGLRRPARLALWASPLLVLLLNGLGNLLVNGYFVFRNFLGQPEELPEGWFLFRVWLFGGHLLAESYRWLLVVGSLCALGWRTLGRYRWAVLPLGLLLSALALQRETWVVYVFAVTVAAAVLLALRRRVPSGVWSAMLLLVGMMLWFHVMVMLITPDSMLDLLRYVMGAYPAIIAGSLAAIGRVAGRRAVPAIAIAYIVGASLTQGSVPYWNQSDTTLAGLDLQESVQEALQRAVATGDSVIVPVSALDYLQRPGLGYVEEPYDRARSLGDAWGPLDRSTRYIVVLPHFNRIDGSFRAVLEDSLPEGSTLGTLTEVVRGPFATDVLAVEPSEAGGGH